MDWKDHFYLYDKLLVYVQKGLCWYDHFCVIVFFPCGTNSTTPVPDWLTTWLLKPWRSSDGDQTGRLSLTLTRILQHFLIVDEILQYEIITRLESKVFTLRILWNLNCIRFCPLSLKIGLVVVSKVEWWRFFLTLNL